MQDGRKQVTVTLDADLLERYDALCRERGQPRDRAIEAMMRRSLDRQSRSKRQAEQGPLDPDQMILAAKALQEVARKLEDEAGDHPGDSHLWGGMFQAAPALLALAAEIALKAWLCRERNGSRVDSHDLVELFDALREDTQKQLEARFPEGPWPLGAQHSNLSGDPFGGGIRTVLNFHRKTFEDWRYPYERDVLYTWLRQLDEAVAVIIEIYNPPPVVRVGSLGNMAR